MPARRTHASIPSIDARSAARTCVVLEVMDYARLLCVVALSACAGGPASTNQGSARVPPPPPGGQGDPGDITAPPGLIEGRGFKIPNILMQCSLTDTSGVGQCAHRSNAALHVTVNKLKDCGISTASHELTLHLEHDSPNDPDDINLTIRGYSSPGGRIDIPTTSGLISITDTNGTAVNDGKPDANHECPSKCTVEAQETTPAGIRHVRAAVTCDMLCVPDFCLICKGARNGPVKFAVEADCP
jgi:hypothetical protein